MNVEVTAMIFRKFIMSTELMDSDWVIPSTKLLCKVQMAVIKSMFRAISYHDVMKASDMKA